MFLHSKSIEVSFHGLSVEMVEALAVAMRVYRQQGMNSLTVTSALDGKHKKGSMHYLGYALDIRIWSIPDVLKARDQIQADLGLDYDVILEKDHIHIEYDPQR